MQSIVPVTRKHLAVIATVGFALVLSACSGGASPASTGQSGGTVTFAQEVGAPPTYIFPMEDGANSGNNNITYLQPLMWRPLYWFGHSNSQAPTINYSLSLAKPPVWSNGGKTVTMNLLHYLVQPPAWRVADKVQLVRL